MGSVIVLHASEEGYDHSHERVTCTKLAPRLAALKGFDFKQRCGSFGGSQEQLYFVPRQTLIGDVARELGITGENDLFGGVVSHAVVATKAITHPLVSTEAHAPEDWCRNFAERVGEAVLAGYAAFTVSDAHEAGLRFLRHGPVRIKPVRETGGRGQIAVKSEVALQVALGSIHEMEILRFGLVLEENLDDVVTQSVGQVRVSELVASYYGTQGLTSDNAGAEVYGGSELLVVRGGFDALLAHCVPGAAREAVSRACFFDAAVAECFPGFFASRRNYDVAQGFGFKNEARCGVLEQSWRIGDASGAEIAALGAFTLRTGSPTWG